MRQTLLTLALSAFVAVPAAAQKLTLEFNDGRVSVDAAAVPVRTILTEWAKLGGTKVIGGDRVAGAPLTLKLVDVPEAQALDVILRSVAGYMAAPRNSGQGASMYDRILVMATSSTPVPAAANRPAATQNNNGNANGNNGMAGTQRFVPPRREPQPADDDNEQDEDDPNPPNPPVFTFPQPGQPGLMQPGVAQPGMFGNMPANVNQPVNVNPGTSAQPITINPASNVPGYQNVAPFGASTPGVIIAPPPQTQPTTQPTSPTTGMIRPPGGR